MPTVTSEPTTTSSPPTGTTFYQKRTVRRWLRVIVFYSLVTLLTGAVSVLFADLLWRNGWTNISTIILVLFVILFALISIGCMHGIFGFVLRFFGDRDRITRLGDYKNKSIEGVSVAVVFPTYNEGVARVIEGLRTTYASIEHTGHLQGFDFFILSDSTD